MPPAVLTWLLQAGELRHYAPGKIVVEAGPPADRLLAVAAGALQYYSATDTERQPVFWVETGHVGGVLPYSRLQVFRGQGLAVGETTIHTLPRSQFPALEQVSPELVQRLVGIMSDRARTGVARSAPHGPAPDPRHPRGQPAHQHAGERC